jgi:dTDP-4-amino-4,6-dideoxygalactose transaminase
LTTKLLEWKISRNKFWEDTLEGVPFLDLKRQYQRLKPEIDQAIMRVVSSHQFILGPELEAFEHEIAQYLGVKYAIGVASGTDALILSLKALGIGPRDEVITSVYSFFSSAGVISWVRAKPVFVDIEKDGFNLDPEQIVSKITKHTRAIIPVHLFGEPAKMDEIIQIAKEKNLYLIDDACQAIGSEFQGKKIGNLSDFTAFSFYPTKVLGAFGDGGLAVTNSNELYERFLELRVHGAKGSGDRTTIGINSRLDAIQAAVLRVKLKYIDQWIKQRREKARRYLELLSGLPISLPTEKPDRKHTYNSFVISLEKRDQLMEIFKQKGIGFALYYPRPFHQFSCFKHYLSKPEQFPRAESASKKSIALPLFPELTEQEQDYVVATIKGFFKG